MRTKAVSYHGYRFPPEIISHAVWLYHRFSLSFRDAEDLLAQRGITVSYETIRTWCRTFGLDLKSTIREHRITDFGIAPVAVERGLDRLRDEAPGAVVLNPSRAGAREAVLDAVSRCPVTKLAYLSCDPTTLCRDLDILRGNGFTIRSIQPIDMMLQTRQVEALALLTRPQRRATKGRPGPQR